MTSEDAGGWTSPYRDPGDRPSPSRTAQEPLTEADLVQAYRNAARADLEALGAPDGVPVAIHAELREVRALLHATAQEVGTLRELLELVLALVAEAQGVEVFQGEVRTMPDLPPGVVQVDLWDLASGRVDLGLGE